MEIMPYPVAPLGLSLVASSIKGKYDVHVFDFAFENKDSLEREIGNINPDYIGISVRNIDNVTMGDYRYYLTDICEQIINPIKQISKSPIIVGGSGFSIAPEEVLNIFDVDYGVVGEGEESFLRLLDVLDNGSQPNNLANILVKDRTGFIKELNTEKDLQLPFSEFDSFINSDNYLKRGSYPLQAKRGCIYKCIYCSYPAIEGDTYRLRSPKEIVDEIESVCKRLPKITFEFVDSTFNSPLDHAIAICDEIIARDLNIKIRTMGINPGFVNEELITKMKKAGFTQIDCTPESASPTVIKNLKKNFTINKLNECARLIKEYDMPTMWFFMFGAPGETKQTVKETFDFIDKHIQGNDMVHITEGIRIFRDTELFEIAIKENIIRSDISVQEKAFYVSPTIDKDELHNILIDEIAKRPNVIHSDKSTPDKKLLKQAVALREKEGLDEPMFRSLLKIQTLNKEM